MENKKKFNKGTELNTDFDLNWYETNFRSLDPQLGRFWQIDPLASSSYQLTPYNYASNNPILRNDPLGLKDSTTASGEHVLANVTHKEVVVTSIPKNFWSQQRLYYQIMAQLNRRHATIDQIVQDNLRGMMNRLDGITKFRDKVDDMTYAGDLYTYAPLYGPLLLLFAADAGIPLIYQGGQWLVRVGTEYIPWEKIGALYNDATLAIWMRGNTILNGLKSELAAAIAGTFFKNNPAQWDKLMKESETFRDMMGPMMKWVEKQGQKPDGGTIPKAADRLHF